MFTQKAVKHYHRLPGEAVVVHGGAQYQARWGPGQPDSPSEWQFCRWQGVGTWWSFQCKPFYNSMVLDWGTLKVAHLHRAASVAYSMQAMLGVNVAEAHLWDLSTSFEKVCFLGKQEWRESTSPKHLWAIRLLLLLRMVKEWIGIQAY